MGFRAGIGVLVICAAAGGCGSDTALTADAGDDFSVSVGTAPEFDGCGSEGEIVDYRWTILGAPESMAADVGKELRASMDECSFVLESSMVTQDQGSWDIELSVEGADGESSTDQVTVTVTE